MPFPGIRTNGSLRPGKYENEIKSENLFPITSLVHNPPTLYELLKSCMFDSFYDQIAADQSREPDAMCDPNEDEELDKTSFKEVDWLVVSREQLKEFEEQEMVAEKDAAEKDALMCNILKECPNSDLLLRFSDDLETGNNKLSLEDEFITIMEEYRDLKDFIKQNWLPYEVLVENRQRIHNTSKLMAGKLAGRLPTMIMKHLFLHKQLTLKRRAGNLVSQPETKDNMTEKGIGVDALLDTAASELANLQQAVKQKEIQKQQDCDNLMSNCLDHDLNRSEPCIAKQSKKSAPIPGHKYARSSEFLATTAEEVETKLSFTSSDEEYTNKDNKCAIDLKVDQKTTIVHEKALYDLLEAEYDRVKKQRREDSDKEQEIDLEIQLNHLRERMECQKNRIENLEFEYMEDKLNLDEESQVDHLKTRPKVQAAKASKVATLDSGINILSRQVDRSSSLSFTSNTEAISSEIDSTEDNYVFSLPEDPQQRMWINPEWQGYPSRESRSMAYSMPKQKYNDKANNLALGPHHSRMRKRSQFEDSEPVNCFERYIQPEFQTSSSRPPTSASSRVPQRETHSEQYVCGRNAEQSYEMVLPRNENQSLHGLYEQNSDRSGEFHLSICIPPTFASGACATPNVLEESMRFNLN
ncbi:hypothetical protein Ciccas_007252 [Cichlidogyrus casuarinus]|uniref:Uncharacterized protein n=1 Tax=Cichlidogyrus casuarinus TaxID=1844966 RepID=A0ABD2Q4K4_9PLAT